MGFIIIIIMGGIIGWLAGMIMRVESQMGLIANIVVGIVGSGLGHFLAGVIGLEVDYTSIARVAVSGAGAVLLIVILRVLGILS